MYTNKHINYVHCMDMMISIEQAQGKDSLYVNYLAVMVIQWAGTWGRAWIMGHGHGHRHYR